MPEKTRKEILKEKFNKDPAALSDEEILELLLIYSGQKEGAGETAKKLISVFGSVKGLMSAPKAALKGIGIADNSAILLSLCGDIEKQIHLDACKRIKQIRTTEDAIELCRNALCTEALENMILVTLDENDKVIAVHPLNVLGTVSSVTVNAPELVKHAIFDNAHTVIIAHNHPHGNPNASTDDVEFTLKATKLLREIGITLKDHIIVGESRCVSMRNDEKLSGYFE